MLVIQEVEYSEEPGKLYYFKYPVAGGSRYLPDYPNLHPTVLKP